MVAEMDHKVLRSRVNPEGVLHIEIPLGVADAGKEVQVTIDPIEPAPISQEEWRRFILATAGSIDDPSFFRHDQGQYEIRESLS
jgi:hypothetical protein